MSKRSQRRQKQLQHERLARWKKNKWLPFITKLKLLGLDPVLLNELDKMPIGQKGKVYGRAHNGKGVPINAINTPRFNGIHGWINLWSFAKAKGLDPYWIIISQQTEFYL